MYYMIPVVAGASPATGLPLGPETVEHTTRIVWVADTLFCIPHPLQCGLWMPLPIFRSISLYLSIVSLSLSLGSSPRQIQ